MVIDPQYGTAYHVRASLYLQQGHIEAAIEDFNACLLRFPACAPVYLSRGIAYQYLGASAKAGEDFTRAIALNPHLTHVYIYRQAFIT